MRSDNKSEEVSHEYLYDPVCNSVGGMATRFYCFSRSGWIYSHPTHRRCNFADYPLCARQDYTGPAGTCLREVDQEHDAFHLGSLVARSSLAEMQGIVCVSRISPKHTPAEARGSGLR